MTTPWLTGAPVRSRELLWPKDDELVSSGSWDREGMSTVHGFVLHWFSFIQDTERTVIYIADTNSDVSSGPIILTPIANELQYASDRVALVGTTRFATAEWIVSESTLKFRVHQLDGVVERESSISVQAAFGDLRVLDSKIHLCISSGPTNASNAVMTPHPIRLGSDIEDSDTTPVFADQILIWDFASGAFQRISIPEPMRHGAEYTFPSDHQVVLAGLVEDHNGQEQLALSCFNINHEPQTQSVARSFSPGGSSHERVLKGMGVASEDNTNSSDIIVHSFDRIAVFNKAFFDKEVEDNPVSGRLHFLRSILLQKDVRVLPFSLSGPLPAVANNRVLGYRRIQGKYQFFVLDFDEQRVSALLNMKPEEREALRLQLAEAGSRVTVVTRQSYAQEEGVGGGAVDAEYPPRRVPPAWMAHLRALAEEEKQGGALIYDEAPEDRREGRWGFVQSELHLGNPITLVRVGRMGLAPDRIVLIPEPGDSGMIWYFE
ncbi:hypothetical protein JR316_0007014 [Psilocybe cubensis]|uniref:Uncharacterized protein n=2 Tax=Psilocybe cubensis TaxID=181762 RepID=A0A8H8CN43_PSICU|nr:hypothetical protein JR316_0007014 [Psilocybe cubensis]KAH9480416.1 hypothetical protein JR316_0007014 [Psilocybe cubensis]